MPTAEQDPPRPRSPNRCPTPAGADAPAAGTAMPTRPTSGAARDASAWLRCPRWPRTRSRRLPDSPAGPPGCAPAATRGHTGAPTPATGTLPAPRRAAHQAHATSIGWAHSASRAPARTTAHPPAAASASGTTATALGRSGSPADHKVGQHPPRQIRRTGYRCRVNRTTGAREPDDPRCQTEPKVRRRRVAATTRRRPRRAKPIAAVPPTQQTDD